jgi:hypothetical protein
MGVTITTLLLHLHCKGWQGVHVLHRFEAVEEVSLWEQGCMLHNFPSSHLWEPGLVN